MNFQKPWIVSASDISRKKKQNFAGFSGANSRKNRSFSQEKVKIRGKMTKNRPISWDFRRQKIQNSRKKSADFVGFLAENSQNLQKNQPISQDF